ncbi:unnamed protein product [Gadus morhua 'NCC']
MSDNHSAPCRCDLSDLSVPRSVVICRNVVCCALVWIMLINSRHGPQDAGLRIGQSVDCRYFGVELRKLSRPACRRTRRARREQEQDERSIHNAGMAETRRRDRKQGQDHVQLIDRLDLLLVALPITSTMLVSLQHMAEVLLLLLASAYHSARSTMNTSPSPIPPIQQRTPNSHALSLRVPAACYQAAS